MHQFIIASARATDLGAIADLFRAYAATLRVDLRRQGFVEELGTLPGAYAPPRGSLLVARSAEGVVSGCVALRPIDAIACELKRLYVVPRARGTGLGKALVARAIAEAGRLGYGEIKLDTLEDMTAAIKLYRSFGFDPIAPYGTAPYPGLVCLGKALHQGTGNAMTGSGDSPGES
jgi:GNAT superfamily N-acetyltransferase